MVNENSKLLMSQSTKYKYYCVFPNTFCVFPNTLCIFPNTLCICIHLPSIGQIWQHVADPVSKSSLSMGSKCPEGRPVVFVELGAVGKEEPFEFPFSCYYGWFL